MKDFFASSLSLSHLLPHHSHFFFPYTYNFTTIKYTQQKHHAHGEQARMKNEFGTCAIVNFLSLYRSLLASFHFCSIQQSFVSK